MKVTDAQERIDSWVGTAGETDDDGYVSPTVQAIETSLKLLGSLNDVELNRVTENGDGGIVFEFILQHKRTTTWKIDQSGNAESMVFFDSRLVSWEPIELCNVAERECLNRKERTMLDWKQGPPPQDGPDDDILLQDRFGRPRYLCRRGNVLGWPNDIPVDEDTLLRAIQHASIGIIPEPLPAVNTLFECVRLSDGADGTGVFLPCRICPGASSSYFATFNTVDYTWLLARDLRITKWIKRSDD